jgi:TolB-like protein
LEQVSRNKGYAQYGGQSELLIKEMLQENQIRVTDKGLRLKGDKKNVINQARNEGIPFVIWIESQARYGSERKGEEEGWHNWYLSVTAEIIDTRTDNLIWAKTIPTDDDDRIYVSKNSSELERTAFTKFWKSIGKEAVEAVRKVWTVEEEKYVAETQKKDKEIREKASASKKDRSKK